MISGLETSLEKVGLTEKEARVYTAALEMGKFSVLALSERTGIKRPTCYLVLDELVRKGLISTFPKAKKVLYVAEHPNIILKNAADSYALAKDLMPGLQELISSQSEKPILKVYAGQKGIQNIYEDILNEGKNFYYIESVADLVDSVGKEFLDDWILRRVGKGLQSTSIRIKEGESDYELYGNTPNTPRNIRYALGGFKMPYTMFIYGKKVAFISTKKELFGFIVESSDLSISMKALFDVVWSVSTD